MDTILKASILMTFMGMVGTLASLVLHKPIPYRLALTTLIVTTIIMATKVAGIAGLIASIFVFGIVIPLAVFGIAKLVSLIAWRNVRKRYTKEPNESPSGQMKLAEIYNSIWLR